MPQPSISLEFFPPKTVKARTRFYKEVQKLQALKPEFMTVTYGAGGSTRNWTLETAVTIRNMTGVGTACHLTCINSFKDDIHKIGDLIWDGGVQHVIALRGDVPKKDAPLDYSDKRYYHYANELIDGLCARHDFEISVAAYPEKHPDAPDLDTDIQNLKRKCEAGNGAVKRAITQFFFENDVYYDFVKKAETAGIDTPIVPGLLPIANIEKMISFAEKCEANVPGWIVEKFDSLDGNAEDQRALAIDILSGQIADLMENDVPHIHFYTLNKADIVMASCKAAGLTL